MTLLAKKPSDVQPRKPTCLIFGKWGVRKTWTALDFPSCYYIDSEGGADGAAYQKKLDDSGGVYLGLDDGADDFDVVNSQILALATSKHDYRTLVIDSFSKLFDISVTAEESRLASMGKDPTKLFGAQRKPAILKTRRMIHRLQQLDMTALLICHERASWQDGEQVGHTFDGYEKLGYELSLVLHIYTNGPNHLAAVDKSRLGGFAVGDVFEWSYDEFAGKFGKKQLEAKARPIQLATKEQVDRISNLAETAPLAPSEQERWFEKAGVTSWEQMETRQMAKCIAFLETRMEDYKQ